MEGSGDKRSAQGCGAAVYRVCSADLDFVRAQERASNFRAMLDEIILVGDLADMPGLSSMLGKEVNLPTYSLGQMDLLLGFDADRPKRLSSYGSALALGVRGISA